MLPDGITMDRMVELTKLRWRIERDYHNLKQELGLGHYDGRGWRGFHSHATLCIAACGFLIAERAAIPPLSPRQLQTEVRSPSRRLPTPRRCRSVPNGMYRTPSQPCAASS